MIIKCNPPAKPWIPPAQSPTNAPRRFKDCLKEASQNDCENCCGQYGGGLLYNLYLSCLQNCKSHKW
jgi:hypothetical protein